MIKDKILYQLTESDLETIGENIANKVLDAKSKQVKVYKEAREYAEEKRITYETVLRHLRTGVIKGRKSGRMWEVEIETY